MWYPLLECFFFVDLQGERFHVRTWDSRCASPQFDHVRVPTAENGVPVHLEGIFNTIYLTRYTKR